MYEGGKVLTTSRKIAGKFSKRHADVIRAIQEMELPDSYRERNFALSSYKNDQGKALPEYIITKDGFSLLVMGFTGKKALQFKVDFIEAFNQMESALKSETWMLQALVPHTDRDQQKSNTKGVAAVLFNAGSAEAVIAYHRKSMLLHAGCSTKAVTTRYLEIENDKRKSAGKKPIKTTPSAKEIIRKFRPEIACAMSVTDSICMSGHKLEEVAAESKAAIPLFKRLLEANMLQGSKNFVKNLENNL